MAARVGIGNAGQYSSGGSGEFFTLQDDGDRAIVTMLYEELDGSDVDYFVVHEVEVEGKRRYVGCNGVEEDGSLHPENCPLCENSYPRIEKLFLQLYNHDTQKVETWDRGRSYVDKIVTYIDKYGALVTQPFEIIRSGRRGDSNTTYEFLPEPAEPDATLDSFPEKQELLGSLILDVEDNDMWDMVDGRYRLPNSNSNDNSRANVRRGSSRNNSAPASSRQPRGSRREEISRAADRITQAGSPSPSRQTERPAPQRGQRGTAPQRGQAPQRRGRF